MFIFTGFRLHMLGFWSILINFGLDARMKRKQIMLLFFLFSFFKEKKFKHVFKKWHFECLLFEIMRSLSFTVSAPFYGKMPTKKNNKIHNSR